ncbi:NAD(P)-dependent oxidoreductase [Sulfuriflexus mobilis]|uniref:NAD(P)-dependent oxidoreductase n=1 Tax=Sulfuriflexus mobilis TaxID=1811807 RepID=UPI000F83A594|nr:SDR family oxidoreductase [Sulfuriflexus mobilis]
MKLTIFGATGTIGGQVVEQALKQGHQVTAFARNPAALGIEHPNLSLFSGDVFEPTAVAEAVKGRDGVLVSLGSSKLTGKVRSVGTQNIVQAMQQHGVKRLVCQSTLGVGESRANLNFFWKYLMFGLVLRNVFKDHVAQEAIVKRSQLDWVIPHPASFTDGPATEGYKHGFAPTEKKLTLKISRADVAGFMLKQLSDDTYLHQTPGLSY